MMEVSERARMNGAAVRREGCNVAALVAALFFIVDGYRRWRRMLGLEYDDAGDVV